MANMGIGRKGAAWVRVTGGLTQSEAEWFAANHFFAARAMPDAPEGGRWYPCMSVAVSLCRENHPVHIGQTGRPCEKCWEESRQDPQEVTRRSGYRNRRTGLRLTATQWTILRRAFDEGEFVDRLLRDKEEVPARSLAALEKHEVIEQVDGKWRLAEKIRKLFEFEDTEWQHDAG